MGSPVSGSITNLVMVDVKPWPYMMSNYHSGRGMLTMLALWFQ